MTPRDKMAFTVRSSLRLDPTIYPVEEKVGENTLQRWIAELLRPLVERWLRERRVKALVGADQFIYYRQHRPTARVSPDVYVMPGFDQHEDIGAWKTWETGVVPTFALEIVSRDWEKDYVEAPERYAELGVGELIIFDPRPERRPEGVRWQVYRKLRGHGLTRVEASQAAAVKSKALGCHLVRVGAGSSQRVRLGVGQDGGHLFPTGEEAERAAKEAERAAKEAERAAKEAERAAKEIALERVAELEAELARRGRRPLRR